jgi:putative endonuclease
VQEWLKLHLNRMFFVFVLWSNRLHKRYVGSAMDVPIRIQQHNAGQTRSTKGWKTVEAAIYRIVPGFERKKAGAFLKTGVGRSWLDEMLPANKTN